MRVTWIHPSWRDLVIDQLARDDEARRHFLRSCGIDGALLALSTRGGEGGQRSLPLLRSDDDWDAIGDRLYRLVPELASDELEALFAALAEAPEHAPDAYRRAEAEALGEQVLGWVARRWDAHPGDATVASISAWFELAATLPRAPAPPHLEGLLLASAPGADMSPKRPEDCERLDDWLCLTEIARKHRPGDLARVGFPDRYRQELAGFLDALEVGPGDVVAADDTIERVLRRLNRLGIALGGVWCLPLVDDRSTAEGSWSTPADPVPPRTDRSLIDRVLRDL